jgi:hypothetical protein
MDSVEDVVERMKRINKDEIQGAALHVADPVSVMLYRSYCIAHE